MAATAAGPAERACACRANNSEAKLVECIRKEALWRHMIALQRIADADPGPDGHPSRDAGEPGYLASVNYVADLMRDAGYRVTIQPYTLDYASFVGTPAFSEVSPAPHPYALLADFLVQPYSGSGDVTAQVQPVGGIVIPATPVPASTSGCSASDFAGFVAGRIALIQRGPCNFSVKIAGAEAAGAAGVIILNEANPGRST